MTSTDFPIEPPIEQVVRQVADVRGDEVNLKLSARSRVLEFLTQAGYIGASIKLAGIPAPELNIGGSSLLAIGVIVADLQNNEGKGLACTAAKKIFGSVSNALQVLGVTTCLSLGGGKFYRMVQDGGINNPTDPRWLIVFTNAAPYLAGSLMDNTKLKSWVENKFGKTIELAYREDGQKRHMTVDTVKFYQQLSFAFGAAHILAFGLVTGDLKTAGIGGAYVASHMVNAGNLPEPKQDGPMARRDFFRTAGRIVTKPILTGDGELLFNNLAAMVGRGSGRGAGA